VLPTALHPAAPPAWDSSAEVALRAGVRDARLAWPGIAMSDDDFAGSIVARLAAGTVALHEGRIPELFLAWACTCGDTAAIAHFEREYFSDVDAAYRRFDAMPMTLDDARQRVRERLFLDRPPALVGYAGTGGLRAWTRATVLYMMINASTREARERPTDTAFFEAVAHSGLDAEAAYLKEACRSEFEDAFAAAMARMTTREKLLLRYAFADAMTVDQIGPVFRVHRATAARWIARARERLVAETRAELRARLRIGDDDAASIVRAALSRMGVSLLRRFG
jgi:RNA polymerase sigma-70 factor (ECF subfamily)